MPCPIQPGDVRVKNIKPYSLGFIGGGWNSAVGATHFIAARMDGLFTIDAGAFSRHAEINTQTAERWGVSPARAYGNLENFLANEHERLDAIVVLTPTPDHVKPVMESLRLGLPVICEKALAATILDAEAIHGEVARRNGFLAVTYNYTGYPMLRELRRMAGENELGEILQVQAEMPQEGFIRVDREGKPVAPQSWRLQDGEIPTISLDLGVHLHHLVAFLTGEQPVEVMATQGRHGNFREIIDNVTCIARYENGMNASFWYSKAALGHRNGLRIRIYGTRSSAEWFQMEPEALLVHDSRGQRRIIDRAAAESSVAAQPRYNRFKAGHPAGFMEAFANLYVDIAEGLAAHRAGNAPTSPYLFSSRDALEGLKMLQAISRSAETRQWIRIDESETSP